MSDTVQGRNVNVFVLVDDEYEYAGCATRVTFRYINEIIGKTDANAGLFRKKRVRISDFSASVQGVTTLSNTTTTISPFYFQQEAIRRTEQTIKFVFEDDDQVIREITGVFLIETQEFTGGAEGDLSEYDIELTGTGSLEISDLQSPPEPTCFEAVSDYWLCIAGNTHISGAGQLGFSFNNQTVLEVIREGNPPLEPTEGTPGEREYKVGGNRIDTWADNPYMDGERIWVLWQEIVDD